MKKKTLILSQHQLDEICGGDSSYLTKSDMAPNFAGEISSDGSVEDGYADATTTDDIADDLTSGNWWGIAKLRGMGPVTVREWKQRNLGHVDEEKEHGNARLKNVNFGATNGDVGKSYGATKTALCRLNAAQETMQTGGTPEIKQKAANTVTKMKQNWGGIDQAQTQYNAAKKSDGIVQSNKPQGMKRKTKKSGLNGVFL